MGKKEKIIICATQRCGSTMVCEDFRATGVFGLPQEYFINLIKNSKEDDSQVVKLIDGILSNQTENGVFSVKLMSNQLNRVSKILSRKYYKIDDEIKWGSVVKLFKDASWVSIKRRDIVGQAISRVISRQLNIYHIADKDDVIKLSLDKIRDKDEIDTTKLEYDGEAIFDEVKKIKVENRRWNIFFNLHNIETISIFYEDIVNNREYLFQLASKFEIDNFPKSIEERKIKKMGSVINKDWKKKYLESLKE